MSLAIVYSRGSQGIQAPQVTVEVHISNGLPNLSIVGLPETAVKESKDRVRGALLNSRLEFPTRRITVNLAPADLPKEGGRFDLPIAIGILAASAQIKSDQLEKLEFAAELSLGGELRSIKGVLPIAVQARNAGRSLLIPTSNQTEAAMVKDAQIIGANHLLEICAHLNGQKQIKPTTPSLSTPANQISSDFRDVHGQYHAKRALEVAAAGSHNLLMMGPPGTGKSMLASRLPGILPPLTEDEALETAAIMSVTNQVIDLSNWRNPPFRAPHHTASAPALVGGGSNPKPGEISLAHNGTLFLDELPEFDRKVLEVLREPLETGHITISRAAHQANYPAKFQLIAAMNPCFCGFYGDESGKCRCTSEQIRRYRSRISGPLLDRIDIHVEVPRITHELLRNGSTQGEESSNQILHRVIKARKRAIYRWGQPNALMTAPEVKAHCQLDKPGNQLMEQAMHRFGLSHRAYHRILKVARTIADLNASDKIQTKHLSEAIGYRKLDRTS